MKKRTLGILFFIIISIIQIGLISIVLISQNVNCESKIVKCYDRNNNEILGQTCKQENHCIGDFPVIFGIAFGSIMFLIVNRLTFLRENF
jgi:hypothetical protein